MLFHASRPLILMAFIGLAAPAFGRSDDDGALVQALVKCRAISPGEQRLSCYDQAAANLDEAQRAGELIVTTRKKEEERRRATFGLPPTDRLTVQGADGKTVEVDESTSVVRSVAADGYDRYQLTLADNSVWQTVESVRFAPESGDKIVIRSAALGTYLARIGGLRAIRIKRIR